jgi:hypothetical protein
MIGPLIEDLVDLSAAWVGQKPVEQLDDLGRFKFEVPDLDGGSVRTSVVAMGLGHGRRQRAEKRGDPT